MTRLNIDNYYKYIGLWWSKIRLQCYCFIVSTYQHMTIIAWRVLVKNNSDHYNCFWAFYHISACETYIINWKIYIAMNCKAQYVCSVCSPSCNCELNCAKRGRQLLCFLQILCSLCKNFRLAFWPIGPMSSVPSHNAAPKMTYSLVTLHVIKTCSCI